MKLREGHLRASADAACLRGDHHVLREQAEIDPAVRLQPAIDGKME